jgi:hypothetical protein
MTGFLVGFKGFGFSVLGFLLLNDFVGKAVGCVVGKAVGCVVGRAVGLSERQQHPPKASKAKVHNGVDPILRELIIAGI